MGAKTALSVSPSQLLSQPSQISGDGVHVQMLPSSTSPSQSSSTPLQISVCGQCSGLPHLVAPSSAPATQLLSRLSQTSPGSKQSHVAGACDSVDVVQGK